MTCNGAVPREYLLKVFATPASTDRVIGIGQNVPFASRKFLQTLFQSFLPMNLRW